MHGEAVLTIPVRSSNSNAPRLHQSHASVIRDTPPISEREETRSRRYKVRFAILPLGGRIKPILSLLVRRCTWSTVHLVHGSAADLGLNLTPLAKKGQAHFPCDHIQTNRSKS